MFYLSNVAVFLTSLALAAIPTILLEFTTGLKRMALKNPPRSFDKIIRYTVWCLSFMLASIALAVCGLNMRLTTLNFNPEAGSGGSYEAASYKRAASLNQHIFALKFAFRVIALALILAVSVVGVKTALYTRKVYSQVCRPSHEK
jgi:hypothetical protein